MYNPDNMPTTPEEFTLLIDHYFQKDLNRHNQEVTQARAQAEAAWQTQAAAVREELQAKAAPDTPQADIDAQLNVLRENAIAQAVSMVAPAKTRAEWEEHFSCFRPKEPTPELAPTLEELRLQKKQELAAAFHTASSNAKVTTADGWQADANETAYRNVQGLLITMENTGLNAVSFCDADNNFHSLNQKELEAVQQLIIAHGQKLYAKKWQLREAIANAQSAEELAAIDVYVLLREEA